MMKGRSVEADFVRACYGKAVDVTPIWMMRQAGRSLPEYRELKSRYGFLDLIKEPELIAQVTLLPFKHMSLDAAIMFADIMLPLRALGVEFEIVEAVGPVIAEPIRNQSQVEAMTNLPVAEAVPTVFEAIKLVRKELSDAIPLIGFSGAPFTLASYLIEGGPSKEFAATKALMFSEPGTWHGLMERLTDLTVSYLSEQIATGVQVVQLFDSWVGSLSPQDYQEFVLPYSKRVFDEVAREGVPRIHFGTGTSSLLELMAEADSEVVGIDWRVPLDVAWERVGHKRAVQGNLEPAVLLGSAELVRQRAIDVLRRAGGRPGHIFNLGHGVLPDSPLDNLKLLVDVVHSFEL